MTETPSEPNAASPPVARALLVGLTHVDSSKYPPDRQGNPWDGRDGCWGCAEDVSRMRELFQQEHYQVSSLLDKEATLGAVQAALEDAAASVRPGDTFAFYYSGHGSDLPDQPEGDDLHDEADGLDETLCLFDGQLRDDCLHQVWLRFPAGSAIFMISDCCHAGTNYRYMKRGDLTLIDSPKSKDKDNNSTQRMKAALLHIGGCRDEQLSVGEEDGGAFTHAILRTWNQGRFEGTWDTFHDTVSAQLGRHQQPQGNLYGPGSELLAARRPFLPLDR